MRPLPRTVVGTGTDLRLSRDPRPGGEPRCHENLIRSSTSEASGTLGAVEVARLRSNLGAAGADPERPARRFRYPGRSRYSPRQCLEGILYVLYTDTPWLQVPYRELGLPSGEI